jgi:(R,R)-butanediol dehydrogenase/meso-butanediol dehydrogenase/diacetyl reductase
MRAARLHGPRDLRVDDVQAPVAGPGEVLLRPLFTGLCGSDLHVWHGGALVSAGGEPTTLGHEFSAEVVEVGPEVDDPRVVAGQLRPGALVAVEPMWTCGRCGPCRSGSYNLCRSMIWHGLSDRAGALAELTVVRPGMVHVLPPGLDAVQGALIEPLAVAHHAVGRCGTVAGGSAVVLGAGPVGLAAALDLVARGVDRLVVTEPSKVRRAAVTGVLAAVGASTASVVDPAEVDPAALVKDLTDGEGVDAVVDAAGVEPAFQAGLSVLRPGGTLVTVATYMQPVTFHPLLTMLSEIDVRASLGYRGDFPEVVELMAAGAFPVDGWVRRLPLADVAEAFELLDVGSEVKLLVDVSA